MKSSDTYKLTKDELLNMTCSESHRHRIIYARADVTPVEPECWAVHNCAERIIKDWDCDFERLGWYDPFFLMCVDMYNAWDWAKADPIQIEKENLDGDGFLIGNGHHRSLTMACLILQDKVDYQGLEVKLSPLIATHMVYEQTGDGWVRDDGVYTPGVLGELEIGSGNLIGSGNSVKIRHIVKYIIEKESDFLALANRDPFFAKLLSTFPKHFLYHADPNVFKKMFLEFRDYEFHIRKKGDNYVLHKGDIYDAVLLYWAHLQFRNTTTTSLTKWTRGSRQQWTRPDAGFLPSHIKFVLDE